MKWYFNKANYLSTLPTGCCTIRELMVRVLPEGQYEYALVQYKDGQQSLILNWIGTQILN